MKPLFFDIETAGSSKRFLFLTPEMQEAWKISKKTPEDYANECSLTLNLGKLFVVHLDMKRWKFSNNN